MDMDLLAELRPKLEAIAPLSDTEWNWLSERLTTRSLAKGARFCKEGEPTDAVGFILRGLFRLSYRHGSDSFVTKEFRCENDVLGAYSSLLLGVPASMTIEALEDSVVVTMPFADLKAAYGRSTQWQQFGRIIAERLYIEREARERQLLVLTASERLTVFRRDHQTLLNRLSQADIAGYLGINPVSLSRLRRNAQRKRRQAQP